VRSGRLPALASDLVPFADGRVALTGSIATSGRIGYPVHLLTAKSELDRSFGTSERFHPIDSRGVVERSLSPAMHSPGTVWVGWRNQYRIELWDTTGRRLRAIDRKPEWFVPWATENAGGLDRERPQTTLLAVQEGRDGVLWTLSVVPDQAWRPDPAPRRRERPAKDNYFDTVKHIDYVLEAIDLRTNAVLATRRVPDHMLAGFVRGARDVRLFGKRQLASGIIVIDVWKLSLGQS
jgi:hypothetical protein